MKVSKRSMIVGGSVSAIGALATAAAFSQERTFALAVSRDAGCGCCLVWVDRMTETRRFTATVINEVNLAAVKQRLGVPSDLASCHTTVVEGLIVEGHAPAEDVLRLLSVRPRDVIGIAVPGMPIGSPGMEVADRRRDAFAVFAFRADGARTVFANYPASV
ncbi:MAG: DUF411 domain-containing protein [Hyphomonadaceae bacterium]|nr:DUF411 domain-containing protein [Hyphomonadaceae bacterium]